MFVEIFVEIFSFPQIQRFIRGGSLQQPQSGAVFSERYKNVNNNIKNNNIKKQHKNSNTKKRVCLKRIILLNQQKGLNQKA